LSSIFIPKSFTSILVTTITVQTTGRFHSEFRMFFLSLYPFNKSYFFLFSMYMSVCKTAEEQGILVLHGNRGSFHNMKQPAFKAIYASIEQVKEFNLLQLFLSALNLFLLYKFSILSVEICQHYRTTLKRALRKLWILVAEN
jgi:UDP-xylose:glucoside alpha-1,3-xylosyltransferase